MSRHPFFFPDENDPRINVTHVLRVPVSLVNMSSAVNKITTWVKARDEHFVCVRDVHGVMQAQDDMELLKLHHEAGLVVPDGMPLVWIGKCRAGDVVGRVSGADLVDALCAASLEGKLSHYFYGGKEGIADIMASLLSKKYPGLNVAGTYSPPFGNLSVDQDQAITQMIADTSPNIVWVGLSTPKQEFWMRDHVGRIPGATLIGVGAAFDFHAGRITRAPVWMQRNGLEWLHRLVSEPRRLWRRYILLAPMFVFLVLIEKFRRIRVRR
tara:strand:- start:9783 stop:10586 length:804 start_codon:yes stop_codon:yes gene_type:complete